MKAKITLDKGVRCQRNTIFVTNPASGGCRSSHLSARTGSNPTRRPHPGKTQRMILGGRHSGPFVVARVQTPDVAGTLVDLLLLQARASTFAHPARIQCHGFGHHERVMCGRSRGHHRSVPAARPSLCAKCGTRCG